MSTSDILESLIEKDNGYLSFSISDSKISDVDIVGLLILDIYFCA